MPQVRRIAASNLKDLVGLIPQYPDAEAIARFQDFNKDEQDSVRLMSIENLLALHKAIPSQVAGLLGDFLKSFASDKSWRIRYIMAEKSPDLARMLSDPVKDTVLRQELVGYFAAGFMQDQEAEVKAIAAAKLGEFCSLLDQPIITEKLVPGMKKLVADAQMHVRS